MARHPHILNREQSALIIIDVQECFVPVIANFQDIEKNIVTLIKGCKILNLPIWYTEQYPKGLGRTVKAVKEQLQETNPVEKVRFSTCCENTLIKSLWEQNIRQIILAGIETHVCILQSALDFTHLGYQVHVVADAVSSRKTVDRDSALQRMIQHGINITTVETALLELTTIAGTDEFKQISALIK